MTRGLIVGKFYPPHSGHHHMITEAERQCQRLIVLVAGSRQDSISVAQRAVWIKEEHPNVDVVQGFDEVRTDYDDKLVWDEHVTAFKSALKANYYYTTDTLFSSEAYGDRLAQMMGMKHVLIDQDRLRHPISATEIRADVLKHWDYLQPGVKAYLTKRVVVVGAESSGTSTLADDLARAYECPCVEEYGRIWTEIKEEFPSSIGEWDSTDFTWIAAQQQAWEEEAARESPGLIICDTNALATKIFEELYLGYHSEGTIWAAQQCKPDQYLLTTAHGVPWDDDGLRLKDGESKRLWFEGRLMEELKSICAPWHMVWGAPSRRLMQSTVAVDNLIKSGWHFNDPL